jgi:hypothetical protein
MRGRAAIAGCVLGLVLAAPAQAQDRGVRVQGLGNPALTGFGRLLPDRPAPRYAQGPRIRFTNDSIIREDGSPGDRRAVVGSVPLVGPLAAEVGLFSVTGANMKERELKRTDPVADVQPRRSRVAAVGLRMNF